MRTTVPAVEVVSSGASYNPSVEAHQRLLLEAENVEVVKLKKKTALKAKLPDVMTKEERSNMLLAELSVPFADDTDSDEEDDAAPKALEGAKTGDQRKTKQQRRRAAEHKKREEARLAEKARKIAENEVFRVKAHKKDLVAAKEETVRRQALAAEKAEAALARPKNLGKRKFDDVEPSIPVKLTEELTGSLRALVPESNIASDRFHSLQKRNLIEVRMPCKIKRRYKLKEYEKRSYKNYDLNRDLKAQQKVRAEMSLAKQEANRQAQIARAGNAGATGKGKTGKGNPQRHR